MKIDGNYVVLDGGRRFYAYAGVLGILNLDSDRLVSGYDDYVEGGEFLEQSPLTPEERSEIAEFMIDRWSRWRTLK